MQTISGLFKEAPNPHTPTYSVGQDFHLSGPARIAKLQLLGLPPIPIFYYSVKRDKPKFSSPHPGFKSRIYSYIVVNSCKQIPGVAVRK